MDPSCLLHWPWNQKTDIECPQDVANSEVYQKFFRDETAVTLEMPLCMDGFVWTGVRITTIQNDELVWYPLGIVCPTKPEPLLHTIFIHYGCWNILPLRFTPEYLTQEGKPVLKVEFPSATTGKIELLSQRF